MDISLPRCPCHFCRGLWKSQLLEKPSPLAGLGGFRGCLRNVWEIMTCGEWRWPKTQTHFGFDWDTPIILWQCHVQYSWMCFSYMSFLDLPPLPSPYQTPVNDLRWSPVNIRPRTPVVSTAMGWWTSSCGPCWQGIRFVSEVLCFSNFTCKALSINILESWSLRCWNTKATQKLEGFL